MNYIESRLRNYMPYMERFGIRSGVRIAQKLFPKGSSRETVSLHIPEIKHPVHVRLGTTDVSNFLENFLYLRFPLPDNLHPELIIDAGANAGYASVVFLNKYPDARVIAIEPESSNVEMIRKNCSPYKNFDGIQSAVWKTNGRVKIMNPEANKTEFRIVEASAADSDSMQ